MIFARLIKRLAAVTVTSAAFLASASMSAVADPNIAVLAFGLFGAQSVFESEAKGAANIVAQRLGQTRSFNVPIRRAVETLRSRQSKMSWKAPANGWTAKAICYF